MENKFSELNVSEDIIMSLNENEIYNPSEIQAAAIGPMLEGLDVIGQAQTGTGKTFAYGIPVIMKTNVLSTNVETLILCPTRELGIQVAKELNKLTSNKKGVRIVTVYGGESYQIQIKALKQKPQIVVGTPGRIIDLMERGLLKFNNVKTLVLDEADEMLNMGFKEDLEHILKQTPVERQTALFSATMPEFIKNVAKNYQKNPVHIVIKKKTLTAQNISQVGYLCRRESKKDLLVRLLDYYAFKNCIVFANTKAMVDELTLDLNKMGYKVDGLHGDLKQNVRDRVMEQFKNGITKILIATDVAARGIDISGLEGIINYDIPQELELYVHRIGRTGRAGESGISISMLSPFEQRRLKDIERYTKKEITMLEIPSIPEIKEKVMLKHFDKIVDEIALDKPIKNNQLLLGKLAKLDVDPTVLINALLNMALPLDKVYNNITPVKVYTPKKEVYQSQKNKPSKKSFIYAHLNIGKKELLRPQSLLQLMEKTAGVRKSNVGDIVIRKSGTTIEITQEAYAYLKKLNGYKYEGTRIAVSKVLSLD